MTAHKADRAHKKTLRELSEATSKGSAVWIDDETGQIIDRTSNRSRTRLRADCERHAVTKSQQRRINQRPRLIDLVGRAQDNLYVPSLAGATPTPMLPERRRPQLLLGKRGGP